MMMSDAFMIAFVALGSGSIITFHVWTETENKKTQFVAGTILTIFPSIFGVTFAIIALVCGALGVAGFSFLLFLSANALLWVLDSI